MARLLQFEAAMNEMLLHISRLGLAILIARVLVLAGILALEGMP